MKNQLCKLVLFSSFLSSGLFFNTASFGKANAVKGITNPMSTLTTKIPIQGGKTWAVAKGIPEAWWGPTQSTVSANYTTYPNQLDEQTVDVQANSGTHQWAYSNSYGGSDFNIVRQKRWRKNGGRLKNQDVDDPDSYKWFLTITFSNPVPANEIYIFLYDMDHRGTTTAYGPSASIKFGSSEATPADFEPLDIVSVPGVDNPMNEMAYGAGGGITFTGITETSDRNAYVALAGKNNKTVKTIEVEMRNIGDDVGFELGWLNVNRDLGDAPGTYGTTDGTSGASHFITPSLYIGSSVDADSDGQAGATAQGDDSDSDGDDENGILVGTSLNQSPPKINNQKTSGSETIASYGFQVKVTNKLSSAAKLIAWLDWNKNGSFEDSEAVTVDVEKNSDNVTKTVSWTDKTLDHANANSYTFMRLRLSSDAGLTTGKSTGLLSDGEVEDYLVSLTDKALPVTLVAFSGRESEPGYVQLKWETTFETASRGFEIQRSRDAKKFEAVGFVSSHNEGNAWNGYEFADQLPALDSKNVYYRLRSVDQDESFSFSTVINVKLSNESLVKFAVWPMPASSGGEITISGASPVASLRLYDLQGREINPGMGHNFSEGKLQLGNIRSGIYLLRINDIQTQKLIIR